MKSVPEFAIFQNSRLKQSAIWTKEKGEWINCEKREYDAINVLVNLLRNSKNPSQTMENIANILRKGG